MVRYNALSYDSEESPVRGGMKQFGQGGVTRARRFFVAPEDLGKLKFYWEKLEHLKHWRPSAREGATLVRVGNRMWLFGGTGG